MQYGKDGADTVRASVIISENQELLDRFVRVYGDCIDQSLRIPEVEKGEWKDLEELLSVTGK